jgi:CDP-diacylglycerol--glycerol-3-phosphate 3-phosphatidyltransferase
VAAGSALGLLEYVRARAVGAGVREVGVLSLGERPNRITAACLGLIAAGAVASHRDLLAGVGAAAVLGLSVIGLAQVTWFVRRRLVGPANAAPADTIQVV